MKAIFFLALMSFSFYSWPGSEWKIVAETTSACKEKFQVLAKEGEKYVYIVEGNKKTQLFSEDGVGFSDHLGRSLTFSNLQDKSLSASSKRFTFTQPSVVDGNPPRLEIFANGPEKHCKMNLK